jgi:hypothetical protein
MDDKLRADDTFCGDDVPNLPRDRGKGKENAPDGHDSHTGTDTLIINRLAALGRSRFRASFRLRDRERTYAEQKGLAVIREHAVDFISERVASADPANDGRQTPMKNHPVFIAQHATASCCRGCIAKWHRIPRGRPLTDIEQQFIVDLIMTWIERELARQQ